MKIPLEILQISTENKKESLDGKSQNSTQQISDILLKSMLAKLS